MASSGAFTIAQSDAGYPETNAYLPLSGYVGTEVPAQPLDLDVSSTVDEHPSVEQAIAQDETITAMYLNFGRSTDIGDKTLQVQAMLMVSSGGTGPLTVTNGCVVDVQGDAPVSTACSGWSVPLAAGDVAVVYIHAYVSSSQSSPAVNFYGTVALTS